MKGATPTGWKGWMGWWKGAMGWNMGPPKGMMGWIMGKAVATAMMRARATRIRRLEAISVDEAV